MFFKSDKAKIPAVVADFDKALALKGTINFQFVPMYFDLVEKNYTLNQAYAPEQVLSIFDKSNKILDAAAATGKDVTDSKSTLETLLVKMKLIDCEFIETKLGPKLAADPTNEELAEQIFTYSLQYKCISTKAFLAALEFKDSKAPTFKTSQVRGMLYMSSGEFDKAETVLRKPSP